MRDVQDIIKRIEYLPPFPVTVTKALRLLDDPSMKADDLADMLKFDQAITSNVLRLCNSSYFGLRRRVINLRDAVVFIGLYRIREILVLSATRQYFENPVEGYEIKRGELWGHALSASIIADNICEEIEYENREEVFLAALLHDVGKLVLSECVREQWKEILKRVEMSGMSFLEAERDILGTDHAEIGAKVLETWEFPGPIIDAVRLHHDMYSADDSDLVNIVRIADTVAMMMGYSTMVDGLAYHGFAEICHVYGMKEERLERIMAKSLESINNTVLEFGINGEES